MASSAFVLPHFGGRTLDGHASFARAAVLLYFTGASSWHECGVGLSCRQVGMLHLSQPARAMPRAATTNSPTRRCTTAAALFGICPRFMSPGPSRRGAIASRRRPCCLHKSLNNNTPSGSSQRPRSIILKSPPPSDRQWRPGLRRIGGWGCRGPASADRHQQGLRPCCCDKPAICRGIARKFPLSYGSGRNQRGR